MPPTAVPGSKEYGPADYAARLLADLGRLRSCVRTNPSFRTGFQALDNAGWLRDIGIHLRENPEQIGPVSAKLPAAAELLKTEGLNVRFTAADLSDPSSDPGGQARQSNCPHSGG